jgi:iron complex outermembrane receptor protein
MRIARSTLIGTAVAMALFGRNGAVQAQTSGDQTTSNQNLQEVVVTGIRASLEQAIAQKRAATSVVDVVTAEDIGKLPDKNIADSLQRLPGVTISSAGANEGGFDEADRVSLRGTNPSLTQTLVNGHSVASGDWFVLDQAGTVGRSVSYTLLPSELVSRVVVHKSSEASIVEGGVAGSVDIITRKPLDFRKSNTLEASVGGAYADLPGTTDPQFSALGNWVNDDHTFGILLQVFSETRHLRRDGQEILGYGKIDAASDFVVGKAATPATATSPALPAIAPHPDLAGVQYPALIGSALFQQRRQRNGGLIDAQWAPSDTFSLDGSFFSSKLEATNVNDNYLFWGNNIFNGGNGEQAPDPGYVIRANTLVSATFSPLAPQYKPNTYGVYDQISRPDESASTNFGNLDMKLKASDVLNIFGQLGVSRGHGRTPTQDVLETNPAVGTGAAYQLNGTSSAPNWNLGSQVNTTPNGVGFGWIFGDQNIDVVDKEWWTKIDAQYDFHSGSFQDLKFGARFDSHQRESQNVIGQGPKLPGASNTANWPQGYQNYPTNYGYGLGGSYPTQVWYYTPAQLAAFDSQFTNRDPVTRADWNSDFALDEKDTAAYVQADFSGSGWTGNVGVRAVRTEDNALNNVSASALTPGAITTSAFGPYIPVTTDHTYNDVLPSANLKLDLTKDLVARFAASQTLARPDYSALSGPVSLGAPPPTPTSPASSGSGSNPDLKPIKSNNFDAGLEWYFAPRSLLSAGLFYMDLKNYVTFGSVTKNFETFNAQFPGGFSAPYILSVPVNADGRVQGLEVAYQQAFFDHWGVQTNYTYADGKQTSLVTNGDDRLVGTSKNTFNVIGYYETAVFSARVAYNYRSEFFSGLDRNTAFSQGAVGSLAASLGYAVNDSFSITLDGMNLNNPTLKYFALNEQQPRAFYKNGAQYYLNLRFKL